VRVVFLLEQDAYGVYRVVRVEAVLVLASCGRCGGRFRVLPCDILPRKLYGLPVIEALVAEYAEGDKSLREVAWGLAGERTAAHTTLHAWGEGLGAHALGRGLGEVCGGPRHATLEAETQARLPATRDIQAPEVDARRYRSEARRERLAAGQRLLLMAMSATEASSPFALVGWCARALSWKRSAPVLSFTSPILFRTGLSSTGLEQVEAEPQARSPPK
jgi:hypothetical protein